MSGLSIRGYARHRGVSHTAVQKAIQSGRISVEPDGTLDPAKAYAEWEKNTRSSKGSVASAAIAQASGGVDFNKARAVKETYNARLAKLTYEERMGQLVSVEEVKLGAFNMARKLRNRILQIPMRISAQLAAETDPHIVEDMLNAELSGALEELSQEGSEQI